MQQGSPTGIKRADLTERGAIIDFDGYQYHFYRQTTQSIVDSSANTDLLLREINGDHELILSGYFGRGSVFMEVSREYPS